MRKRIQIFDDGKQGLLMGGIEFGKGTVVEEYEVEMKDKEFEELMEDPQRVRLDRIKNKRKIKEFAKRPRNV